MNGKLERERHICCGCFGLGLLVTQLLWFVGESPSLALDAMRQSHSINHDSSPNLSLSSPLLQSALVDTDDSNSMHAVDHQWIRTQVSTTRWWILLQCLPLPSRPSSFFRFFICIFVDLPVQRSACCFFQVQPSHVQSRLVLGHSWTNLRDVPGHVKTALSSPTFCRPRPILITDFLFQLRHF